MIAFLDPENVDFDILYAILLTLSQATLLCVIVLAAAILNF